MIASLLVAGALIVQPLPNGPPVFWTTGMPNMGLSPIQLDLPPCPKSVATGDNPKTCTTWEIRQHYHLNHRQPWPHDGDACDPKKPAPEGYDCQDDDAGKPPPGMTW